MYKRHDEEFDRCTLKNSETHTVMNSGSILEQKLFTMSIYTTYWKEDFSNVIYAQTQYGYIG